MAEEPDFSSRLRRRREKLEAMDREEDGEAALDLLERAVEAAESLGSELEGEK